MVTWFCCGVLSVRPGVSSARWNGVRPIGSSRVASVRTLTAPDGAAAGCVAGAFTSTVSFIASSVIVRSSTSGDPSGTETWRCAWAKPGKLEAHDVVARRQAGNRVHAVHVGDGGPHALERGGFDGDRHAGQRSGVGRRDASADRTRLFALGECRSRQEHEQRRNESQVHDA